MIYHIGKTASDTKLMAKGSVITKLMMKENEEKRKRLTVARETEDGEFSKRRVGRSGETESGKHNI